jgi:hypothetical protein
MEQIFRFLASPNEILLHRISETRPFWINRVPHRCSQAENPNWYIWINFPDLIQYTLEQIYQTEKIAAAPGIVDDFENSIEGLLCLGRSTGAQDFHVSLNVIH